MSHAEWMKLYLLSKNTYNAIFPMIASCAKRILKEMSNFLYQLDKVSGEAIFIDGTKIEACANKYTFVWKKAVT